MPPLHARAADYSRASMLSTAESGVNAKVVVFMQHIEAFNINGLGNIARWHVDCLATPMDLLSLTSKFSSLASQLRRNGEQIADASWQLSSGNRIRRAADDIASLSVATGMLSRSAGMRAGLTNMMQASSLLQVADGGLQQIQSVVERMQTLATMAGSGALSTADRGFLNLEFFQMMQEAERLAQETRFNRRQVLALPPGVSPIGPGNTIIGTTANDLLQGSTRNDTITGFDGNDSIIAGAGDDLIQSQRSTYTGMRGKLFSSATAIPNLATALAIVATGTPTAEFRATSLDYPNGAPTSGGGTIGAFLGVDAASLTNPAASAIVTDRMVYEFTGSFQVATAGTYSFNVASDDGFRLEINGQTISEFTGLRGFAFTNASATLPAGIHSMRLVYFENAVGNGLQFNSSLSGSGIVDASMMTYQLDTDGSDMIDAGDGNDIVTYDGFRSDYAINELGTGRYSITDMRNLSPNGTDTIVGAETLRFADGEIRLDEQAVIDDPRIMKFDIAAEFGGTFDYAIVDATTQSIFDNPENLNVLSADAANTAADAAREAITRLTDKRAYIGSKQAQADIIRAGLSETLRETSSARAVLTDTNIPVTSTAYAQLQALQQAGINVAAQSELLRFDMITQAIQEAAATQNGLDTEA